jgi:hypothetical protein
MLSGWLAKVTVVLGACAATILAQAVPGPNARVVNSIETLTSAISDGIVHIVVAAHISSVPSLPSLKPETRTIRVRHASRFRCRPDTASNPQRYAGGQGSCPHAALGGLRAPLDLRRSFFALSVSPARDVRGGRCRRHCRRLPANPPHAWKQGMAHTQGNCTGLPEPPGLPFPLSTPAQCVLRGRHPLLRSGEGGARDTWLSDVYFLSEKAASQEQEDTVVQHSAGTLWLTGVAISALPVGASAVVAARPAASSRVRLYMHGTEVICGPV